MQRCIFTGCPNQVVSDDSGKCLFHLHRSKCVTPGCANQVYARNLCVRHGDGCQSQVHLQGKCFRHGGNRQCIANGCEAIARLRGLCARHTPKPPRLTSHHAGGDSSPGTASLASVHAEVSRLLAYYYNDDET
ncbi:hypothetical protein H310_09701 [Aphanomyces invadans]|uniref:Uncharacterized protein n=1 Tax=Aphanomyces invadans TaxID=157072 RepID=A0A024TUR7_9STRA|nr:hypothetical protein H310_09701 [Aphanomyces invadans]ETV97366.1 hypothetical protein H310_09701 [Aphanomyces invadans]|eukprot:XP_008874074.1 hypothetical protein H310_09701 [Aphanomyces invadans]